VSGSTGGNIIDSLVITLGLNAQGFQSGARTAGQTFNTLMQQFNVMTQNINVQVNNVVNNTTRASSTMQNSGKHAANFFTQIRREAVALFSVLEASRGFKDVVADLTNADAALGRMANNVEMSVGTLSNWGGAAREMGGNAKGVQGAIFGLSQQFIQFSMTGQSAAIPYLRQLGVSIADVNGHMLPMNDIMMQLADHFSTMDPAKAQFFGHAMGLDTDTINLLMKGRAALQEILEIQQKLNPVTERDTKLAQQRQTAWYRVTEVFDRFGRDVLNELTPAFIELTTWFEDWIAQNREWISQDIVAIFRRFTDIITNIPFQRIADDVGLFFAGLDNVAKLVGGYDNLFEIAFSFWLGTKFLQVMAAMGAMRLGLIGLGTALATYLAVQASDATIDYLAKKFPWIQGQEDKEDAWVKKNLPSWSWPLLMNNPDKPSSAATPGAGTSGDLGDAIYAQESGSGVNTSTSPTGARGPMQIEPNTWETWKRQGFVHPNERIDNADDNLAVAKRRINAFVQEYGGDKQRAMVAYYSGPGNVRPVGEAGTPWINDFHPPAGVAGPSTSEYVAQVTRKLGNSPAIPTTSPAANAQKIFDMTKPMETIPTNDNSDHSKVSSIETHVGTVNIHTQATDARSIAGEIKTAMANVGTPMQANYGHA
jgi:hypothetical protein